MKLYVSSTLKYKIKCFFIVRPSRERYWAATKTNYFLYYSNLTAEEMTAEEITSTNSEWEKFDNETTKIAYLDARTRSVLTVARVYIEMFLNLTDI